MKRQMTRVLAMLAVSIGSVLAGVQGAAAQAAGGCATPSFAAAAQFPTGRDPLSVTTGDFNGDGKLDLAAANRYSFNVSVLLGDGLGGFAAAVNSGAGDQPVSLTAGDFNADGTLDLATANIGGDDVTVLIGDGAGGFAAPTHFATAIGSNSVTTGDFNADGKLDLATGNSGDHSISVLLGDGLGGFAAAVNLGVGPQPLFITTADFNADGELDLVTANTFHNSISVLLGNGVGGFATALSFSVGAQPGSVATGDFNGDGRLDAAVANWGSGTVSVLIGDGLGGLAPLVNIAAGNGPQSATTGDFNADGTLDLAIALGSANSVGVLLGDGLGSFAPPVNFGVGDQPRSIAMGDFNADGQFDLATANTFSGNVSVLLNTCRNTAPTAVDDSYNTDEDNPLNVAAPGVIGNDPDNENDTLTATLVSGPSHAASFSINADGSFRYTPAANFHGWDSFTYKVSDGEVESNTAIVAIAVNAVNDNPVAAADAYATAENTRLTVAAAGVLANDSDRDGDALSAVLVSGPSHGMLTLNPVGSFIYTPAAGFAGFDTFTYRASDGSAVSAAATVTLTVTYRFTGFFQPVDNLPTVNGANAGQAIPIKFSLGGNQGLDVFASGGPTSQAVACGGSAIDDVEATLTAGNSGLQYDAATGVYTYVWKTEKSWKSSCRQLTVQLKDGTTHIARFQFK